MTSFYTHLSLQKEKLEEKELKMQKLASTACMAATPSIAVNTRHFGAARTQCPKSNAVASSAHMAKKKLQRQQTMDEKVKFDPPHSSSEQLYFGYR